MDFCSKCGTRLVPQRKKEGKEAFLVCPKCDYKKPVDTLMTAPKVSGSKSQDQIIVIGRKEQKLQTLPTVTIECPKCGNKIAYVWQVQTRGADESSTQFFRCTKCSYTFREYS
ncbi:MAG: transcription factor S [Candidatus Bathyarchaeota archaeon]|nr:transcription factor S [Candidatus Bathyarchaeota archaeon]